MIRLRYFASLRETLGVGDEQLDLPDGITDVASLARWLQSRDEVWDATLSDHRLHAAVNQEVVRPDAPVSDGDEVAWFPPVTGG